MQPIKSSEISSYLFCPVSWWIGITKGVKITKAMTAGLAHHELIAKNQFTARIMYACIIITIFIFLAFAAIWVLS